jgi:hypothetical protein
MGAEFTSSLLLIAGCWRGCRYLSHLKKKDFHRALASLHRYFDYCPEFQDQPSTIFYYPLPVRILLFCSLSLHNHKFPAISPVTCSMCSLSRKASRESKFTKRVWCRTLCLTWLFYISISTTWSKRQRWGTPSLPLELICEGVERNSKNSTGVRRYRVPVASTGLDVSGM